MRELMGGTLLAVMAFASEQTFLQHFDIELSRFVFDVKSLTIFVKNVAYLVLLALFLVAILVAAALGVSYTVYSYMDGQEQASFEDQFNSDASKVLESIGKTLDNTMGPADALIVNYLAYGRTLKRATGSNSNETAFPFVTLPSYGVQAAKLLPISKAFQVFWAIKVEVDELQDWKDYADQNHAEWIDNALDVLEGDPEWTGKVFREYARCPDIFGWGGTSMN